MDSSELVGETEDILVESMSVWIHCMCVRVGECAYNSNQENKKYGRMSEGMGVSITHTNVFCLGIFVFQFFFSLFLSHTQAHTRCQCTHTLPLSTSWDLGWNVFSVAYFYVCIWFAHASHLCSSSQRPKHMRAQIVECVCRAVFCQVCVQMPQSWIETVHK